MFGYSPRAPLWAAALTIAGGLAGNHASAAPACDPYKDYTCLDTYLGDDVLTRFERYYELEWGQSGAPSDPNAASSHREGWPTTPQTTPPMPFTEWPYGGATSLGVTLPGSVDSPLMVALAHTGPGSWLADNHFQLYGWVDAGVNVSSNTTRPGGNAPIAYSYTPNTAQLDQFVLYLDRFPDTVQTDHIDWGMRVSAIYGENYRYTTAYGIASNQLLKDNSVNGYDFPMVYGEVYIPFVAEGLNIRAGRYISVPDIEAQLAPNNYMYSHSLTYSFDNYTNEGVVATLAVTKNFFLQAGIETGTEAPPWHMYKQVNNPAPNVLYPNSTFYKDPGDKPAFTLCARLTWNDGNDSINPCANGINDGTWGYNNLQWYGTTYYHKFNDHWHISYEIYEEFQNNVPNGANPQVQAIVAAGGTPFSSRFIAYNAPNMANCHNPNALTCRATAIGTTAYINYSPNPLDNFSFRPEYYDDQEGQRSGTRTGYYEFSAGWQHWFSPQIEIRPELGYYRSISANAFNGNSNAGIPGDRNYTVIGQGDLIVHF